MTKSVTTRLHPYAIIECEHSVPSQITLFGFCGFHKLLRVDLPPDLPRERLIHHALSETRRRLVRYGGIVPFMGKPVALIINMGPNLAVRYDMEGRAVAIIGHEKQASDIVL